MEYLSRALRMLLALVLAVVAVRWVASSDILPSFSLSLAGTQLTNAQLGRPTLDNTQEWAGLTAQYQGSSPCARCHSQNYTAWSSSDHATVNCETCHGPARAHLKAGEFMMVDSSREFCGTCHAHLPSRPAVFPQVDVEKHNPGSGCVQCHNPHRPGLTQRRVGR